MQLFPVSQGVTLGCDNKGLQPIFPTHGPTIVYCNFSARLEFPGFQSCNINIAITTYAYK